MPLADVTNTHHHRSANSHIVVAPLQKRVSSAMSATNTATKLTDMFGKKNVAASSSSKTDEEEDFFASCAKDEAVVRKGTAPFCFTRLFLLLLSYLYVVSMRHKRARARQLFTSLFFFHKHSLTVFRPPLLCYTKKNVNSETDDGGTSAGETPESSEESRRRRRRRLGELGVFVFVHHRWRSRTKTAEEGDGRRGAPGEQKISVRADADGADCVGIE